MERQDEWGRNQGDRKRPASEAADQLTEVSCPCAFHQVLEVFPQVHEGTLVHEIVAMREIGLLDDEICQILYDRLLSNGGNFAPEDLQHGAPQTRICPLKNTSRQSSSRNNNGGDNYSAEMEEGDFECQCCFSKYAFHCMVQCAVGHLFCKTCLRNYANSAISGDSKSVLSCISTAPECKEIFPRGHLEAALSSKMLALLDEREQEESVRLATAEANNGEKLSQCPHCNFKCILPNGNKVIECLNEACGRSTCVACGEDWKDHFGIPCSEFEKKDEANIRKTAEEKMTAARVRRCHQCQTALIKERGCNKLTCRCGAKMCYICRASIRDYSHFCDCDHPRNHLGACQRCNRCICESNSQADDEKAIEEIRLQAEQEKAEKGYANNRMIATKTETDHNEKVLNDNDDNDDSDSDSDSDIDIDSDSDDDDDGFYKYISKILPG